jgi:hypothetical protein
VLHFCVKVYESKVKSTEISFDYEDWCFHL